MAINEVLAALADETRRKILFKLKEGKINSGDLACALGMTPQALSYHLSKLKKRILFMKLDIKILSIMNLIFPYLMKQLCG